MTSLHIYKQTITGKLRAVFVNQANGQTGFPGSRIPVNAYYDGRRSGLGHDFFLCLLSAGEQCGLGWRTKQVGPLDLYV